MASATLVRDRLPRLQQQLKQAREREYTEQWREDYAAVKAKRDATAQMLRERYSAIADELVPLMINIAAPSCAACTTITISALLQVEAFRKTARSDRRSPVNEGIECLVSSRLDHNLAAQAIAMVDDNNLLRTWLHGVGLLQDFGRRGPHYGCLL
jgi:hypothetical protein